MRHTWTVPVSSDSDDGGSVQVELLSGCKRLVYATTSHKKHKCNQFIFPAFVPFCGYFYVIF